jgi:hypothetical protein
MSEENIGDMPDITDPRFSSDSTCSMKTKSSVMKDLNKTFKPHVACGTTVS